MGGFPHFHMPEHPSVAALYTGGFDDGVDGTIRIWSRPEFRQDDPQQEGEVPIDHRLRRNSAKHHLHVQPYMYSPTCTALHVQPYMYSPRCTALELAVYKNV